MYAFVFFCSFHIQLSVVQEDDGAAFQHEDRVLNAVEDVLNSPSTSHCRYYISTTSKLSPFVCGGYVVLYLQEVGGKDDSGNSKGPLSRPAGFCLPLH